MTVFKKMFLFFLMTLAIGFEKQTQAASNLSPEVLDAIDQKVGEYRRQLTSTIEESLKSEVFGDLRLVALDPKPDLAKIATEFKKNDKLAFSTLPNSVSRSQFSLQMIENMKMTQLRTLLKPFQVTVTLSASLSPTQRTLAKTTLDNSVELPKGSTLNLKFENLNSAKSSAIMEKTIEEKSTLEKEKLKSKEEAEKIAKDRDFIAGDKRTLDINLQQEKSKNLILSNENDKLKGVIEDLKKNIAAKESELDIYKTPMGDIKKLIKGLELPLTLFPIFITLFFSLIVVFALLSAAQKKRAGMMKEGVELMAATIGKLGGKLGGTSASSSANSLELQKMLDRENSEALNHKSNAQQSFAGAGSDLISQEMQNLKNDSENAWKEALKQPFVMMCILKEWLLEGAVGQERFMCLASTLSPFESAKLVNGFHHSLTKNLKNVVTDVNSRLQGYSYVLTLHRSVQDFLRDHTPASNGVEVRWYFMASETQITKVVFGLAANERAALMRTLPPAAWKRILEAATELFSPDEVSETLASMADMSDRVDESNIMLLISKVDQNLGQVIASEKSDDTVLQMAELAGSLETFSPKLRSVIALTQNKYPKFAEELESRTVTIDHVLRLDRTLLSEILEPFESEQVAQLISSLEQSKRGSLVALLGDKLRVTAEADYQRFSRSPSALKRAEVEGQKIQSEMVTKLKKLAGEGIVEIPVLSGAGQNLRKGA